MLTIHTLTQLKRIPISSVKKALGPGNYKSTTLLSAEEFDAVTRYVEGEEDIDMEHVFSGLGAMDPSLRSVDKIYSLGRLEGARRHLKFNFRETTPSSSVALIGTDGRLVYLPGPYVRQFTLLRDFFDEYPDRALIELPYESREIARALSPLIGDRQDYLSYCLDLVKYLNPVRNTYYLDFILTDVLSRELESIAKMLTEDEREELLQIDEIMGGRITRPTRWPLPGRGQGLGVLASSCNVQRAPELCYDVFSSYPSWVYCNALSCLVLPSYLNHLLVNSDFSKEPLDYNQEIVRHQVRLHCFRALEDPTMTWTGIRCIFCILGRTSSALMNQGWTYIGPYGIDASLRDPIDLTQAAKVNIERVYPGDKIEAVWDELAKEYVETSYTYP